MLHWDVTWVLPTCRNWNDHPIPSQVLFGWHEMTCLWDTTYFCWVFLSWLHFLTGFLHFCARSVGFGPAKQTTCSWQQALHPYITCPWFRPNSDSLRITHSLLQDPEQASSHRTSIRRKRLRWNWSWMIQLKRKHNGLGVKWMQPSLAPSLEIGYAEPAANSNLKQYREENCMHSSLLFLYTHASSSTFITCTTWVTQPYLNPSAHGPTWSSERLTAIYYMCDHCLSLLISNLSCCLRNPGKVFTAWWKVCQPKPKHAEWSFKRSSDLLAHVEPERKVISIKTKVKMLNLQPAQEQEVLRTHEAKSEKPAFYLPYILPSYLAFYLPYILTSHLAFYLR